MKQTLKTMKYCDLYPNEAYMLSQSAEKHPQMTRSDLLMTLIKSGGIVMSSMHRRWLFAFEKLASRGFPVFNKLLLAATNGRPQPVCSFNIPRHDCHSPITGVPLPARKRNAVVGQSGDTMNVNVIGSALMFQFGYVIRLDNVF